MILYSGGYSWRYTGQFETSEVRQRRAFRPMPSSVGIHKWGVFQAFQGWTITSEPQYHIITICLRVLEWCVEHSSLSLLLLVGSTISTFKKPCENYSFLRVLLGQNSLYKMVNWLNRWNNTAFFFLLCTTTFVQPTNFVMHLLTLSSSIYFSASSLG